MFRGKLGGCSGDAVAGDGKVGDCSQIGLSRGTAHLCLRTHSGSLCNGRRGSYSLRRCHGWRRFLLGNRSLRHPTLAHSLFLGGNDGCFFLLLVVPLFFCHLGSYGNIPAMLDPMFAASPMSCIVLACISFSALIMSLMPLLLSPYMPVEPLMSPLEIPPSSPAPCCDC